MLSQRTFPQGEDGLDDFLFTEKNSLASYGYNIQNSLSMKKLILKKYLIVFCFLGFLPIFVSFRWFPELSPIDPETTLHVL